MAKCGNCGSQVSNKLGPKNTRLWIDPCPSDKDGRIVAATCVPDEQTGETWPAMSISSLNVPGLGDSTPVYCRSHSDPCQRVIVDREFGDPEDKTVDIEVDRICGGLSPLQLQEGLFDVYVEHVCACGCGSSTLSQASMVDVIRGISLNGYSIPTISVGDGDGTETFTLSFSGATVNDYQSISDMGMTQLFEFGENVIDVKFLDAKAGCQAGDGNACGNCGRCYVALHADSTLTIGSVDEVSPDNIDIGIPSANVAISYMGCIGNKIYVFWRDTTVAPRVTNVSCSEYEGCGNVVETGDWPTFELDYVGIPTAICEADDRIYVGGVGLVGTQTTIQTIDSQGNQEILLEDSPALGAGITAFGKCGGQVVGFTRTSIFKNDGCGGRFSIIPSPAISFTNYIRHGDVRVTDELWVVTNEGEVHCSTDCGENWEEQTDINVGPAPQDMLWHDSGIGYVATGTGLPSSVYSTFTSGKFWTSTSGRVEVPDGLFVRSIATVCCDPNCIILAGNTPGAVGSAYIAKPKFC